MIMNKVLMLLAVCLAAVTAAAETIVFRSGEILAAEISSAAPRVAHLSAEENTNPRMYALVTVKLPQGRTISTEDYSLNALGALYRCIAIREDNGAFDAANWHMAAASPKKKYGLLFALSVPVGQNYNNVTFELVSNAPGKWNRTGIPFTDRRNQAFTPASSIPVSGKFPAAK